MAAPSSVVLCRLDELGDPGSRGLTLAHAGREYAVFVARRGAVARAWLNSCPHTGAPLDWMPDRFLSADEKYIQCAMHAALFRIEDGVCIAGPCVGEALVPLPTTVENGLLVFHPRHFRVPESLR